MMSSDFDRSMSPLKASWILPDSYQVRRLVSASFATCGANQERIDLRCLAFSRRRASSKLVTSRWIRRVQCLLALVSAV